ncbi:MAG: site-specific integrase [Pseudomonadota bacterium]
MSTGMTKDGRWYCHFRDIDGKGCREYYGRGPDAKTAAETRDLEIKLLKKRPRTEPVLMALGAPTFETLSQSYINHRAAELAESTRREIISAVVNDGLPVMGHKRAGEIDMKDLTALEKRILDRGAATQTVNRRVGYLSRIFSWAMERQIIKAHPWPHRKPLKTKRFRVELPELEDLRRIMAHAPDHLRWAMEVEYHTGLRPGPSELFKLKWSDIDMFTGMVKIYSSKTDRVHHQYVSLVFRERLKRRRTELIENEELCEYVVSFRGAPVRSLKTVWGAAKRLAGITRPLRLYDIRHFYASHALVQGANILELAERLGHVNSEMVVKVYAHLAEGIRSKDPLQIPDLYAQDPLPAIEI